MPQTSLKPPAIPYPPNETTTTWYSWFLPASAKCVGTHRAAQWAVSFSGRFDATVSMDSWRVLGSMGSVCFKRGGSGGFLWSIYTHVHTHTHTHIYMYCIYKVYYVTILQTPQHLRKDKNIPSIFDKTSSSHTSQPLGRFPHMCVCFRIRILYTPTRQSSPKDNQVGSKCCAVLCCEHHNIMPCRRCAYMYPGWSRRPAGLPSSKYPWTHLDLRFRE